MDKIDLPLELFILVSFELCMCTSHPPPYINLIYGILSSNTNYHQFLLITDFHSSQIQNSLW